MMPIMAVSLGAIRVHAQGLLASFEAGHAAFVTDCFVASLGAAGAVRVAELCAHGIWTRVAGGYEVVSSEARRMVEEVLRELAIDTSDGS